VRVLQGDVLTLPPTTRGDLRPPVVANLPYNISTPVVFRLLELRRRSSCDSHAAARSGVRLASPPGRATYGVTSVLVPAFAEVQLRSPFRGGASSLVRRSTRPSWSLPGRPRRGWRSGTSPPVTLGRARRLWPAPEDAAQRAGPHDREGYFRRRGVRSTRGAGIDPAARAEQLDLPHSVDWRGSERGPSQVRAQTPATALGVPELPEIEDARPWLGRTSVARVARSRSARIVCAAAWRRLSSRACPAGASRDLHPTRQVSPRPLDDGPVWLVISA